MTQINQRQRGILRGGILSVPTLVGALALSSCTAPPSGVQPVAGPTDDRVVMPQSIDDPFERVNRGVWAFNHGFLDMVVSPIGHGYRAVVPKPVRRSVKRFGYNLGYPGRALNQLLQGRVRDAGDESLRFVTNTTVGLLGFFDPATRWEIPKPTGDFAQTFQTWGWHGGEAYLMLPLLGPSDEMHLVGTGCDIASDPLTYSEDARYVMYGLSLNEQADEVEDRLRMIESEADAYSTLKYFWSYSSRAGAPDWSVHAPQDPSTLETLAVATMRLEDAGFVSSGREARVKIPSTGKKLPFNYWLQDDEAPLVYLVPGLGSHRLTTQIVSTAEQLHRRGFSVAVISGLFHPEFVEFGSGSVVPGYAPDDRDSLEVAIGQIDRWLVAKHGGRIGARAMVGLSMGGFQTLALAAKQARGNSPGDCACAGGVLPRIERFIAINPPVDLHYGMDRLDAYMDAPREWPGEIRQQRADNALHKAVAMATMPTQAAGPVPIDGIESKYLIGLVFRQILRNALFTSQLRHDMGLLEQPVSKWKRKPVYDEIMNISFSDYFENYVTAYHRDRGVDTSGFKRANNLRHSAPELAGMDQVQVITSRNDFLLSAADIAWLERTFGARRLVLLERGGHMGGMTDPAFFELLGSRLSGLGAK